MAHLPVCRHFLRNRCKYGLLCRFRHELTEVRALNPKSLNTRPPQALLTSKPACRSRCHILLLPIYVPLSHNMLCSPSRGVGTEPRSEHMAAAFTTDAE